MAVGTGKSECGEGKELRQFMPRSRRIPKGKPYTGSNLLAGPGMEVPQHLPESGLHGLDVLLTTLPALFCAWPKGVTCPFLWCPPHLRALCQAPPSLGI